MAKKITPALFHLFIKGKLPKLFKIVGFSRRDYSQDDFADHVRSLLLAHKEKQYLDLWWYLYGGQRT